MPIFTNIAGAIRLLTDVTVNEGGVLHELDTVHANEGGVLREIHSGQNINIYATGISSPSTFTVNEYDTGIVIRRNLVSQSSNRVYIDFKGVKAGDVIEIELTFRRHNSWYVGLQWYGCDIESTLPHNSHISKGYIDIYGSNQNHDPTSTISLYNPGLTTLTATSGTCGIMIVDSNGTDTEMPMDLYLYSVKINGKEQIKKPYYNYIKHRTLPYMTFTKGKSDKDLSTVLKNFVPTSAGFEYELSIDPGGAYNTKAEGTITMVSAKTVTVSVTLGAAYDTGSYTIPNYSGSVGMTLNGTSVTAGSSKTVALSAGNNNISIASDECAAQITGSQSGTSTTVKPRGYRAVYKMNMTV